MPRPALHQSIAFEHVKVFVTLDRSYSLIDSHFRCVSFSKLEQIVANGVDVSPVRREIYATQYFEKAWEYGDWPKVTMAFDSDQLERTFKEVPADISPNELAKIRKTYPTMLPMEADNSIWLSRLPKDDPHITKSYEREYCRWIPGDPFAALKALLVFTDDEALCADLLLPMLDASPYWNVLKNSD